MDLRWLDPSDRSPAADALWRDRWTLQDVLFAEQRPGDEMTSDPEVHRTVALTRAEPRLSVVALADDDVVGGATLTVRNADEPVLAYFFGGVHPGHRGRGTGRALLGEVVRRAGAEGARSVETGVEQVMPGLAWADVARALPSGPGARLLLRAGFREYHRHVVSRAPLDAPVLAGLAASEEERLAREGRYTVEAVIGVPPEEWLAPMAGLMEAMAADTPHGDKEARAEHWDAARVREKFSIWPSAGCTQVVAVARTAAGVPVGYTEMASSVDQAVQISQGDTLVLGAARGHGLGLALKATALALAARTLPDARWSETGNAVDNLPMIRVNRALGYRPFSLIGQYRLALDE